MTKVKCVNGHRHTYDSALEVPLACPTCKRPLHLVETTNPTETKTDKL